MTHMGETLPFFGWRLDQRARAFADHAPEVTPSELVRRNIRIATAGAFSDQPVRCALDAVGEDNVKIEHQNAQALVNLHRSSTSLTVATGII
jgi:hypothetical protein